MHKLIASLAVLSALSATAHAETPQFPDPNMLPPDTQPSTAKTTTGNSAASIYVYPQADTATATTNIATSELVT